MIFGLRYRFDCLTLKFMHTIGVKTIQKHMRCGASLIVDTNDRLALQLCGGDRYEMAVRQHFERFARRGVNILDIGANIGYYSVLGGTLIGPQKSVFSFEPQSHVAKKLRRNIEHNCLTNVAVFPFALSDTNGTADFSVPIEGWEGHGSLRSNGRFQVMKTVEVKTRRLDDVIAESAIPNIGLIKMDAEGAELSILRGATKLLSSPHKPVLIFEATEDNSRPFGYGVYDLLHYVTSFGYRVSQISEVDWLAEPNTPSQQAHGESERFS